MKTQVPTLSYGAIIILTGIFLILSKNTSFESVRFVLGLSATLGALPAFISALHSPRKSVQLAYHALHMFALLSFGIAILFFCKNAERQMYFTAFLLTFYALSEIIFCSWIFNLAQTVILKILVLRVLVAMLVGIGTVVILNFDLYNMQLFGILFVLVGGNIMLYVPIMKVNRYFIYPKVVVK